MISLLVAFIQQKCPTFSNTVTECDFCYFCPSPPLLRDKLRDIFTYRYDRMMCSYGAQSKSTADVDPQHMVQILTSQFSVDFIYTRR